VATVTEEKVPPIEKQCQQDRGVSKEKQEAFRKKDTAARQDTTNPGGKASSGWKDRSVNPPTTPSKSLGRATPLGQEEAIPYDKGGGEVLEAVSQGDSLRPPLIKKTHQFKGSSAGQAVTSHEGM
jgi:hypothetical protein